MWHPLLMLVVTWSPKFFLGKLGPIIKNDKKKAYLGFEMLDISQEPYNISYQPNVSTILSNSMITWVLYMIKGPNPLLTQPDFVSSIIIMLCIYIRTVYTTT